MKFGSSKTHSRKNWEKKKINSKAIMPQDFMSFVGTPKKMKNRIALLLRQNIVKK